MSKDFRYCDSVSCCLKNDSIMELVPELSEEGKYNVYQCGNCGNRLYEAVDSIPVSSVSTDPECYEEVTYSRMASERLADYIEDEYPYDEDDPEYDEDEAFETVVAQVKSEFDTDDEEFIETRDTVIWEDIEFFKESIEEYLASKDDEEEDEEDEDDDWDDED